MPLNEVVFAFVLGIPLALLVFNEYSRDKSFDAVAEHSKLEQSLADLAGKIEHTNRHCVNVDEFNTMKMTVNEVQKAALSEVKRNLEEKIGSVSKELKEKIDTVFEEVKSKEDAYKRIDHREIERDELEKRLNKMFIKQSSEVKMLYEQATVDAAKLENLQEEQKKLRINVNNILENKGEGKFEQPNTEIEENESFEQELKRIKRNLELLTNKLQRKLEEPVIDVGRFEDSELEKLGLRTDVEFLKTKVKTKLEQHVFELTADDIYNELKAMQANQEKRSGGRFDGETCSIDNELVKRMAETIRDDENGTHSKAAVTAKCESENITVGEVIKFTDVMLNDGDYYDPATGVFTVNVDGLYVFGGTVVMAKPRGTGTRGAMAMEIVKNGDTLISLPITYSLKYEKSCGMDFGFVYLKKGDKVYCKASFNTTGNNIYAFSGALVRATGVTSWFRWFINVCCICLALAISLTISANILTADRFNGPQLLLITFLLWIEFCLLFGPMLQW